MNHCDLVAALDRDAPGWEDDFPYDDAPPPEQPIPAGDNRAWVDAAEREE